MKSSTCRVRYLTSLLIYSAPISTGFFTYIPNSLASIFPHLARICTIFGMLSLAEQALTS